jgi:hypothetical protein
MNWIQYELGEIELGDKRRVKRLMSMVEKLASQPKSSIPMASEGWAETKAAYRLIKNKALDATEILACHAEKSKQRAAAHKVVLCQDKSIFCRQQHELLCQS